ncbi:MAG: Gldg family protein [Flavobacteriales bacterium]|nr:Gldg family protein [Flavobacteriales bacterium]
MKRLITLLTISIVLSVFYSCNSDTSEPNKENIPLQEESKLIVKSLKDKIYINIYMSGDLSPQFQKIQSSITSILEKFQNISNKEIDFEYVIINDNNGTENQKGIYNPLIDLDLHPIFITSDADKVYKTYPYAIVNFREKTFPVLLYNSLYYDTISDPSNEDLERCIENLEYNFIESFYLIQQEEMKKIAFLYGNGELDSTNTWDIRNTLSKFYEVSYFDLRSFEIDQQTQSPDIQRQIDKLAEFETIIIAKPTQSFLEIDKYLIDQYIINGGKTLWLLDGTSAHMNNFGRNLEFEIEKDTLLIEDYLSAYGAKVNHDLIQDEKCSNSPIIVNNEVAYVNWQYNPLLISDQDHIISVNVDSILTNFVSSIEITKPEKTTILLSSSEKSNIINEGGNVHLDIIKDPPKEHEGKKSVAVLIEDEFSSNFSKLKDTKELITKRKSPQNKMIIISDGDIISNLFTPPNFYYPLGYYHYGRSVFDGNTSFILNSIQYLCDDEVLIKVRNKNR